MKDLAVATALLGGSSQGLGQDEPSEARRNEYDRPLRNRLVLFRVGKEGVGVAQESLYWRIFEVVRIPVVCEYAGLGHGRWCIVWSASQLTSHPSFFLNTHVLGDCVPRPWMAIMLAGVRRGAFPKLSVGSLALTRWWRYCSYRVATLGGGPSHARGSWWPARRVNTDRVWGRASIP
ncbi:hypothetical protein SODALDRAFT_399472 [Sodiomyces alkalinus F11]|uniref:Uncharacterized protein n=1 Tax=Sodiomyces alkalinus (strain CBS 110278 / VKM F-3762 / F11) TaxID=1314773 RepID=A0A3N2PVU3_SODAK|nr:hypothetical protein SODALDRAFT_399472 [Sodiomyces alkalinus F11]ROT38617.1 hypothetical protein SODALDRAFT_399472 [Sodiomyces alkalinus F11]